MIFALNKIFDNYLVLSINKENAAKFFRICSFHNINIVNLIANESDLSFEISLSDYFKLRPIARKTKPKIKIIKKHLVALKIKTILRSLSAILGAILFLLYLYFNRYFVSEIKVYGNTSISDEQMIDFLNSNDIHKGNLIFNIDCSDIEMSIREHFAEITWVSAYISGSKLIIDVNEREIKSFLPAQNFPSNLISDNKGLIYSIVVREGTAMVKAGEIVNKGDILISGIISTCDESGNWLFDTKTTADGDVYILSELEYFDEINKIQTLKNQTGRNYKYISFSFDKNSFVLRPYKENYINSQSISSNKCFRLLNKDLSFTETYVYEYELMETEISDEELYNKLNENFNKSCENLGKKGIQILSSDVKIDISSDKATMYGKIYTVVKDGHQEALVD